MFSAGPPRAASPTPAAPWHVWQVPSNARCPSRAAVGLFARGFITVSDTGACWARSTPVAMAATQHATSLIRLFIVKETIPHGPNTFVHERAWNPGPRFRAAGCGDRQSRLAQGCRRPEGNARDVHLPALSIRQACGERAGKDRPR